MAVIVKKEEGPKVLKESRPEKPRNWAKRGREEVIPTAGEEPFLYFDDLREFEGKLTKGRIRGRDITSGQNGGGVLTGSPSICGTRGFARTGGKRGKPKGGGTPMLGDSRLPYTQGRGCSQEKGGGLTKGGWLSRRRPVRKKGGPRRPPQKSPPPPTTLLQGRKCT